MVSPFAVLCFGESAPGGQRVPLGSVARIDEQEGRAEISHVNGSRLIIVEGNVSDATSVASSTPRARSSTTGR